MKKDISIERNKLINVLKNVGFKKENKVCNNRVFFQMKRGVRHFGDFKGWCYVVDELFSTAFDDYDGELNAAKEWKAATYQFIKEALISYQISMRSLEYIVEDRERLGFEEFRDACLTIKEEITPFKFSEPTMFVYGDF